MKRAADCRPFILRFLRGRTVSAIHPVSWKDSAHRMFSLDIIIMMNRVFRPVSSKINKKT